jgi:hypothetical protein
LYWINLNQNLNRFISRVRIADSRYYNQYQIRIRFCPVYHWRWFFSNWAKRNLTGTFEEFLKNLPKEDKAHLKRFLLKQRTYHQMRSKNINNAQYRDTYKVAQWLSNTYKDSKPKLRIEWQTLDLYTSDPSIFTKLQAIGDMVTEVSLVSPSIGINEVERDKLPLDKYKYRVILKDRHRKDPSIIETIKQFNANGTIKMTDLRLSNMKKWRSTWGDWFYVEDDYALTLVHLTLGDNVSKVLKYVRRK